MMIVPTCVVPLVPQGGSWTGLPSVDFYRSLFFDLSWGLAGFWLAQTGGRYRLQGEVLDWMPFISEPAHVERPFDRRAEIIKEAVQAVNAVLGPQPDDPRLFYNASAFVFILAPPPGGGGIDGGAHGNAVTASVGDRFDLLAHELGHVAIGLAHSFDLASRRWDPFAQPGEYGNPYCIMSAQGYGADGGREERPAWVPAEPETRHYGPSLSQATRVRRGWQTASDVPWPNGSAIGPRRLSSAGDSAPAHAQALRLTSPRGEELIVSYRQPADLFDTALSGPAVVVEQVGSGRAEVANPGAAAATCLGWIRLPLDHELGGQVLLHDLTLDVVDWSPGPSGNVAIRLRPANQPAQARLVTEAAREVGVEIVEHGVAKFAAGEVHCMAGAYPWALLHREVEIELRAELDTLDPPDIEWRVQGRRLPRAAGTLLLPGHRTRSYPPPPYGTVTSKLVHVSYELSSPQRLLLRNWPAEGTYDLDITCRIVSAVGSGTLRSTVTLEGQRMVMDPRFEADRQTCRASAAARERTHKQRRRLLLPGDFWRHDDRPVRPRVEAVMRDLEAAPEAALAPLLGELAETLGRAQPRLRFADLPTEVDRAPRQSPGRKG